LSPPTHGITVYGVYSQATSASSSKTLYFTSFTGELIESMVAAFSFSFWADV
jgi:hypothetical protein